MSGVLHIAGDVWAVPLGSGTFALINACDVDAVSPFTWGINNYGYAVTRSGRGATLMHRMLVGASDDRDVDHANGLRLDNRRINLRLCTVSQNLCNRGKSRPAKGKRHTSTYKGVWLDPKYPYWYASITFSRVRHHLGTFKSEEEAARAYDIAAKQHHGPFARLNFPSDQINVPPEAFFKPQENSECATSHSVPAKRRGR